MYKGVLHISNEIWLAQDAPKKKWRKRSIILVVIIVGGSVLGVVGYALYQAGQADQCNTFVGCTPIDVPVVLNASMIQSGLSTNCGVVTQGYPQAVVCDVIVSRGSNGTIMINMRSQNGDSQVAFGTYASSQYVQFHSTYSCLYSTSQPDYNTLRCPVAGDGTSYTFNYTVSQFLPSEIQVILTIVVTKTCCWP
jgi:hypothetical protein